MNDKIEKTSIMADKTGVGALIISSKTKRILLNLRAPHKTHSQQWSLWGGMVENNEQPKDALLRELSEEMNFVPDIERIYPFDIYQSKDKHFKYISFVAVVEEEFIPELNSESCGYAWINLSQWPKPMHQGAKISFCNSRAEERLRMILAQHKN
jgi:ADP-ribose pyrophosphatase YjhB (NUDIX family)